MIQYLVTEPQLRSLIRNCKLRCYHQISHKVYLPFYNRRFQTIPNISVLHSEFNYLLVYIILVQFACLLLTAVPLILGDKSDFPQADELAHDEPVAKMEAVSPPENQKNLDEEEVEASTNQLDRKARQSFSAFSSFGAFGDSSQQQNGGLSFQRVRMGHDSHEDLDDRSVTFEVFKHFTQERDIGGPANMI